MADPLAAETLYFYDLETSGFSASAARIVQFAGQRTDLQLKPIGEPHNIIVKLSPDVLPDPDAVLVTGITPQQTIAEGITEAEFLKIFISEVATPGTIFLGFNSIRFDDEFMRHTLYRNFHDAYEWAWQDGRSRWDMLDLVRMTRALRPEGIKWPTSSDGKPGNRLELLASLNGLDHQNAHDALSDVRATIELAQLIRGKQPKLFDYLLSMRRKDKIVELVKSGEPFVYTSGKYPPEFEKTTVVGVVGEHPKRSGALVFDLRHDPGNYASMTPEQLAEAWRWHPPEYDGPRLPVKTMQFNRCPAVAPLGVLDADSQKRLQIDLGLIKKHLKSLRRQADFAANLNIALEIMDKQQQSAMFSEPREVDGQLYDNFIGDADRRLMPVLRASAPAEFGEFGQKFSDDRLKQLLPLYKARNFPADLSDDERAIWQKFCEDRLMGGGENSRMAKFFKRLAELDALPSTTEKQRSLLMDLQLYGQSLLP